MEDCSTDECLQQETLCHRQWTDEYVEHPETLMRQNVVKTVYRSETLPDAPLTVSKHNNFQQCRVQNALATMTTLYIQSSDRLTYNVWQFKCKMQKRIQCPKWQDTAWTLYKWDKTQKERQESEKRCDLRRQQKMERERGSSDVRWKTVPQTSVCNRKRSVTDSGQMSTSNVQRRWWGRT